MRIKRFKYTPFFLLISALFVMLALLTPSVSAVGKPTGVGGKPSVASEQGKLRACQAKENAIKKQVEQLDKLATNMQEKFEAIAKRVEDYYALKVIPSGKKVANYSSLVAAIQTKKEAVQTALTQSQATAASFSCTSDNPRGQMTQFKEDMKAVKAALKDYRTAIKNLIVAVHSENE